MKKFLALFLSLAIFLSGCSISKTSALKTSILGPDTTLNESTKMEESTNSEEDVSDYSFASQSYEKEKASTFTNLNDEELLDYVETTVYSSVQNNLGDDYKVESVDTTYISKEYLEELNYNSQTNLFYGYSLEELDAQFEGTRYIFTYDNNGDTEVIPFESYDDTYEKALKNVAIGTGVILICVTVSLATAGAGAPAASMIFAASAKSGAIFATSSGALSGVIAATVTGIQTGDFDEAKKSGILAASESFKWGAISGAVAGGSTELITLKNAASGGLSMNEAATIMKESKLPANFLKQIHSVEEYNELVQIAEAGGITIQEMSNICMSTGFPIDIVKFFKSTEEGTIYIEQAGLSVETVNGQLALVRSIDLTYESELAGKTVTNLERMKTGLPAIDPATGQAYQLHHIGQDLNSPLAILTKAEHMSNGNNAILHDVNIADGKGVHSLLSNTEWAAQREAFWKGLADILG